MKAHDDMLAVARAQASFDDACGQLDAAVMSLVDIDGETVMADAHLVSLLLRVVAARRHLQTVKLPAAASLPASLR